MNTEAGRRIGGSVFASGIASSSSAKRSVAPPLRSPPIPEAFLRSLVEPWEEDTVVFSVFLRVLLNYQDIRERHALSQIHHLSQIPHLSPPCHPAVTPTSPLSRDYILLNCPHLSYSIYGARPISFSCSSLTPNPLTSLPVLINNHYARRS